MDDYFSGKKLFGDDFTFEQLQAWYNDEKEGYATLLAERGWTEANAEYWYHHLNILYGYRHLPKNIRFERAMGLGSAYGNEFLPVIERVNSIHIVEPSDQLVSKQLQGVLLQYKKPSVEGKLDFDDNFFQLETCFGTLHHIPNVSFVLSELHRCLTPGGFLLIREPVISMGDWRNPRPGLTKRERGIPVDFFRERFNELDFRIVRESFCYTMTAFLQRKIGHWFKKGLCAYRNYLILDNWLSKLTVFNLHYHAKNPFQRIAPTSVFYILQKK